MKKTNFLKRVAAGLLAGVLAIATLPMLASAAPLQSGDSWETILNVNPADFAKIEGSGGGGKNGNVQTSATIDGTVIRLDTISHDKSTANHWATSKYSNIGFLKAYPEISAVGAPYTDEEAKVIFAHRGDVQWGGDLASPKSGINITPIYGGKDVKTGDTIKITAWVYADDIVEYGTKTNIADQTTPVDVRMWAYDPWKSNSEKGYNTDATVPDVSLNTKMVSDKWTELVLEYVVTDANKKVTALSIDNGTESPNPYPLDFYFAGAKIERKSAAGGSYTGGYAVEEIFSTNADGFVKTSDGVTGASTNSKTFISSKDFDGINVDLKIVAGGPSYDPNLKPGEKPYYGIGIWSNFNNVTGNWSISDTVNVNPDYNPVGQPETLGQKVLIAERKDARWGGVNGSSAIGFNLEDCYGGQYIAVGDTIRITAWVYGYGLIKSKQDFTALDDQSAECDVRMFVQKPYESDAQPGYNTKAEIPRLSLKTKMKGNEWTKLVLEYTLTQEDMQAGCLVIDNSTPDGNPYPKSFVFGSVAVEKVLTDEDPAPINGTVKVGVNKPSADAKIIVVAYENDMFKACQIIDYVAGKNAYDFELDGVYTTDSVKAYIWNFGDAQPITEVLELEAK